MADETRKIKIIPETYPHDIGEVEITIDEQEIKDYGFITAYKNTLKTMLERVKNTNFHTAVGANTDYNKINSVPILWRDKNNKLDYDAREKDLTLWFSESLENKINELSMAETEQMPPITHTPEYIIKLIDAGKITNDYRVITTLNDCATFLHDILPVTKRDGVENKNISPVTLQQLRKKDGTNFDPKTIEQAITYGNSK